MSRVKEIISNTKNIDIDTLESVDSYIDEICSDPAFLCSSDKNKQMCGKNTSIYTSVENVNNICENIKKSNQCENDIKECLVSTNSQFEETGKYVSTSFSNIIIPINKAFDMDGNQKFLRLPALSASKKKNSNEICSVCACMDRFARSPGSGFNDYSSPGQNKCVFGDDFEYYYYPLYIEQIRNGLKDTPPVMLGDKYNIINSNIIHINTEDDLSTINLYNILTKKGISENVALNFIKNILYKNNKDAIKDINFYLLNKKVNSSPSRSNFGNIISNFGNSVSNVGNNVNLMLLLIIIIILVKVV